MEDLINRLEKLARPARALDCEIAKRVGYRERGGLWRGPDMDDSDPPLLYCPSFTASFDAALTLVPDGLYWMVGFGKRSAAEPLGGAFIFRPGDDNPLVEAEAPTVMAAICIAGLKARMALSSGLGESD